MSNNQRIASRRPGKRLSFQVIHDDDARSISSLIGPEPLTSNSAHIYPVETKLITFKDPTSDLDSPMAQHAVVEKDFAYPKSVEKIKLSNLLVVLIDPTCDLDSPTDTKNLTASDK